MIFTAGQWEQDKKKVEKTGGVGGGLEKGEWKAGIWRSCALQSFSCPGGDFKHTGSDVIWLKGIWDHTPRGSVCSIKATVFLQAWQCAGPLKRHQFALEFFQSCFGKPCLRGSAKKSFVRGNNPITPVSTRFCFSLTADVFSAAALCEFSSKVKPWRNEGRDRSRCSCVSLDLCLLLRFH